MCFSTRVLLTATVLGACAAMAGPSPAATIAPPMLDIARQCNALAHKNTAMMSECVVAESEARADLLQHWDKLPDASVDRCIKLGVKAKRQPYVLMEKCLSPDLAAVSPNAPRP